MNVQKKEYGQGTSVTVRYPFGVYVTAMVLCPDGKVRKVRRIAETADTVFSVPAAVDVKRKTVAGFITVETAQGLSTPSDDDPLVAKFVPYTYRKNHTVFQQQAVS